MSDTPTEPDNVRHMDVGEHRTVKETQTYDLYAPDVYYGSDREVGPIEVDEIEIVEPEREGDYPEIDVTWSAEVTKKLGPRWDKHDEPVTEREEKKERRKRWISNAIAAATVLLPVGISVFVATKVMSNMGNVTINGEQLQPIAFTDIWPVVILMMLMVAIIMYGMKGGLPGMAGRRARL